MASARIQRWALTLSAYDYVIAYKRGEEHANADLFSRLPLPDMPTDVPLPGKTVLLMETVGGSPVSATHIKTLTDHDPLLSQVRDMLKQGCQDVDSEELRPFQQQKNELSIQDGCVLWGSRVVIPQRGRQKIMEELHDGHLGISKMNSLARSVLWWPGPDAEIEK